LWTRLRGEAPVAWHRGVNGGPGFWMITKYQDLVRISRDPNTFLSGRGVTMPAGPEVTGGADAYMNGRIMLMTDPPTHTKLRSLVNKGFTPRRVAAMESHIRDLVGEILGEVLDRGECDFVTDVAAKLPVAVICELMGIPRDGWELMFDITNRMIGADDPEYQSEGEDRGTTGQRAQQEMFAYFYQMLAQRKERRANDLMSLLIDAEIDGEKLSEMDILLFSLLLVVAGNETTRNATSGGLLALLEHPEEHRRLLADRALLPSAIEEMLRWVSPVMHFSRYCAADTSVRDQPVKAGERVVMFYPSVNRDEDVFEEPFRFDVTRTPNDHLAFGIGEHFCLGANLARLEMRVLFEELLWKVPNIRLAGDIHRLRSNLISGIKHMPVSW
jgi:cytochrome P450